MEAGRRGVDAVPTLLKKCSRGYCGWPAVAPINLFAVGGSAAQSSPAAKQNVIGAKNGCSVANGFR